MMSPVQDRETIATFRAGVASVRGRGAGRLVVAPRKLVVEFGRVTKRLTHVPPVTQVGERVNVIIARALPWMGVAVVVTEEPYTVTATVPRWRYRRLLKTLATAGISPDVRATWFSSGTWLLKGPVA
jgi:hypothetical protein